ncbi:MAG: alpha-N-acetylglucosaminidase [Bacteroidales bacterium]|nr:alpha-N-acetylglucosaminidase [Bacteroidales bacterium]
MKAINLVKTVFVLFCVAGCARQQEGDLNVQAAEELISRVLPQDASSFRVEYVPSEDGKDVFEIESCGRKIVLRGNNGVSVASALNYYLENYAHCDFSWNASNLEIPKPLPKVDTLIHRSTAYDYRHYFNYCTFNYTASWWDWDRWEKEIDYMALHGINMPLAMTGQNAVWDRVYRKLGFDDEDMDKFFTGPAYFMWFWAGNIDAWCGPLPASWKEDHEALQKKILARERELGMKPVLPAFTGHVPPTFVQKFPNAKVQRTNWEGRFDDTFILSPDDPMFKTIGNMFMEEQIKTYGTDHLYGADTFNEMVPPQSDPQYLHDISAAVYNSMADVDPEAVWVMQGWLFVDKAWFWHPEQIQSYLSGVPDDGMIVLDLWAEENPVWNRSESFYGKPWIWCMLHNFGGRNMMYGNARKLSTELSRVLNHPDAGNLVGMGAVPEGIEQNPIMYSLLYDQVWQRDSIDIDQWIINYSMRRYGKSIPQMAYVWKELLDITYSNEGNYESSIMARPTFEKDNEWAYTDIPYDPLRLVPVWKAMLDNSEILEDNDCYRYDLLIVTKQVLANYAREIQQKFHEDYVTADLYHFRENCSAFNELIDDIDALLSTRSEFLLGKWISDARAWGHNEAESDLYEKNARDIVTLWGGADAFLHDYASKQWAGLFGGFYKSRWKIFLDEVDRCIESGAKFDYAACDRRIRDWEWEWVNTTGGYSAEPEGNTVEISKSLYNKYIEVLQ